MKKGFLYGAVVSIGIMGLAVNVAAKDHNQGYGQYHHDRDVRHSDHHRDGIRAEHREHERHEIARRDHDRDREFRRERERREWARNHRHEGHHSGWEKGRNNPHHDANWRPSKPAAGTSNHGARPVANSYGTRPVRGPANSTHNR